MPKIRSKKIMHVDDERSIGNSIIVTLEHGWKFGLDGYEADHVRGFDNYADAIADVRDAKRCRCPECEENRQSVPTDFIKTFYGPLAVIRECMICSHIEKVKVGQYGVGRGYGMREGNKARGRLIQHIKKEHGDVLRKGVIE